MGFPRPKRPWQATASAKAKKSSRKVQKHSKQKRTKSKWRTKWSHVNESYNVASKASKQQYTKVHLWREKITRVGGAMVKQLSGKYRTYMLEFHPAAAARWGYKWVDEGGVLDLMEKEGGRGYNLRLKVEELEVVYDALKTQKLYPVIMTAEEKDARKQMVKEWREEKKRKKKEKSTASESVEGDAGETTDRKMKAEKKDNGDDSEESDDVDMEIDSDSESDSGSLDWRDLGDDDDGTKEMG